MSSGTEYTIKIHLDADEAESFIERMENFAKKTYTMKFSASGATREISKLESAAKRVERVFSSVGNGISRVGSGMQSLGNLFGGRVVNTAKTMATAFGTMGLYSAAQGTVERYDTMRMFPKMMQHLGYSAKESTQAIKTLEDAVIGLPTGLDEIADSARQLIPLSGSLNKGVNLAIAANNAFLAGGSDAQSVRYGQRQIKDLLAKGTLRSQEWDSLFTALGSGLGVIAEEMGYSSKARKGSSTINDELAYAESRLKSLRNTQKRLRKEGGTAKAIQKNSDAIKTWTDEYNKLQKKQDKSLGSFRNALKTNQISALDFLDALEKVGTGEGELAKRADDYKDTISAAARNIKNSLQKLGAAGLESLDNVLTERTGKGIPGTIREISDSIKQNLVPALGGWVSDNGDKIVGFFDKLKNYDWIGLVSKVGKGLAQYYDIMTTFFTKVSPKVVAFLSVWAGPIGRMLQTAGGIISGLGPIVGRLVKTFGTMKAAKLAQAADGVASVGKVAKSFKSAFAGLGLAAGGVALAAEIGAVVAEWAKVIELISNIELGDNFSTNIDVISKTLGVVTLIASSLTAIGTALAGSKIGGLAVAAGEGLAAGFIAIIGEIGGIIAEYVSIIGEISTMTLPSKRKISDLGSLVTALNTDVIGNVKKVPTTKVTSLRKLAESTEYVRDIAQGLKAVKEVGNVGNLSNRIRTILESTNAILDAGYGKEEKKKAKTTANTLENMASSVKSVEEIASSLAGMKANIKGLIKRGDSTELTNLTSGIENILAKLDDSFKGMRKLTKERQTQMENIERLKTSVDYIGSMVETLHGAKKKIKGMIKLKDDGTKLFPTGARIGTIVSRLLEAFDDTNLDLKTQEREIQLQNIERVAGAVEAVGTIVDTLQPLRKKMASLVPAYGFEGLFGQGVAKLKGEKVKRSPVAVLGERIKQLVSDLNEINKAINEEDVDTSGDVEEKIAALASSITLLPDLVTNLNSMRKPLSKLGIEGEEWPMGNTLKTMISGIAEAFTGVADADMSTLGENSTNMLTAVETVRSMVKKLVKLKETIDESFTFTDGSWDLGVKLGQIFSGLTSAFGLVGPTLNGTGGAGSLASVAPQLDAIGQGLGLIASNASGAASGLQSAASGLDKLASSSEKATPKVKEVADAASDLKSGVTGIGGGATGAAGGVAILGGAAKLAAGPMQRAADAATALASAINSIPSQKTVNVSVSGSGASYQPGTVADFRQYASGGSVHGPGGIDNVGAWLTNGEYVMRRRAHSRFGTAFMNRVNALDVDGALRALTVRAGSGVLRGTSITNNYTRDNHATVTFNVSRASQGYAQHKASKWARSLG